MADPLRPALRLAAVLAVVATGCPEPDDPMSEGTSGEDDTTTGASSTGAADETAGEFIDVPARGITISRVDVNSGVAITVAENGVLIAPQDRPPIPKNRNTAVRVYVDIDEEVWVQRDIEARLTMILPDGTDSTLSVTETIAADSSLTNLQSNFLFGATAELIVPDVAYRVQLFEVATGFEDLPEPAVAPAVPETGSAFLGTRDTTQRMRVVLVPIDYTAPDGGACQALTDTSEQNVQAYADALFQHNPTEEVEITVREPIVVDDIDLGQTAPVYLLLNRLSELRAADDPDPDVYYYGLFDNCSACIQGDGSGGINGCLLGIAPGIAQATQGAAAIRVSVGVTSTPTDDASGLETFVHEIGHNQGRNHVACPGQNAAGPDVAYPHDNGSIGVWGFGVIDFGIRNASNHTDYMSYCNPTWVSDYQWEATFSRIRELSSWGFGTDEAPPREDEPMMLVGAVNQETGEQRWWTGRGTLVAEDYDQHAWGMSYALHGGATIPVAAAVNPWPDGPWVSVRAPLGAATASALQAVELVMPQRTTTVAAAEIRGPAMQALRRDAAD